MQLCWNIGVFSVTEQPRSSGLCQEGPILVPRLFWKNRVVRHVSVESHRNISPYRTARATCCRGLQAELPEMFAFVLCARIGVHENLCRLASASSDGRKKPLIKLPELSKILQPPKRQLPSRTSDNCASYLQISCPSTSSAQKFWAGSSSPWRCGTQQGLEEHAFLHVDGARPLAPEMGPRGRRHDLPYAAPGCHTTAFSSSPLQWPVPEQVPFLKE